MNRLAIVFWSGTGNTEQMAECIAQGAREAGAQVELLGPEAFSAGRLGEFDVVAFGCPAMGAEQLEEDSFEPMFSALEDALAGKKIALFGSFGWGDGEWMRTWSARCQISFFPLIGSPGRPNPARGSTPFPALRQTGKFYGRAY